MRGNGPPLSSRHLCMQTSTSTVCELLIFSKKFSFSRTAEWAITFCNCTLSLMSVAMGSWGASGAGTSLTYVLCRSGHISAGFSASGNGWTFSRLLVVCIHLILPRPQLGMATGQLWGFGTLLDSQAVSSLFLLFFIDCMHCWWNWWEKRKLTFSESVYEILRRSHLFLS